MTTTTTNKLIERIRSGETKPLYFLFGREKYFHDLIIKELTNQILPDRSSRDLNLTILYGTENDLSEVMSAALSYPMLSDKKLVIVREFDKMKFGDAESFIKYLNHPQSSTCIIFSALEAGRTKPFIVLKEKAETLECRPLWENKVGEWVRGHCKSIGLEIESPAIEFLVNHLGNNLLMIDQELQKISNYKVDGGAITIEDVEQTTGITRDFSVFALQKSLTARQLKTSISISKILLESGENINVIVAVLFAHFRKLLIAASMKQKGNDISQIKKMMKLSDFQSRDIVAGMANYSVGQIKSAIRLLHELDISVKTSAVSDIPGLQMICFKICSN